MVHQRRKAHPDRPMIIIKNRTLAATWRHCELLPEALPDVQQIFQWRTTEDVVGSFIAAAEANMISPSAHYLAQRGMDGNMWHLNGRPAARWMERSAQALCTETSLALQGDATVALNADTFARHGQMGFLTFMSVVDAHIGVALGQRGLWSLTLQYEDLMTRKSACMYDLLRTLGWLHLIPDVSLLGTPEADKVFYRDAHAGGGLMKQGGTTLGGDQTHLQFVQPVSGNSKADASRRENAHLPQERAAVVRALLRQHGPLHSCDYNLGLAAKRQTRSRHVENTCIQQSWTTGPGQVASSLGGA